MESRLHVRESVDFAVRLVQHGRVVATVKAIDMSLCGLGVEPPNVVLNSGQVMDVEFFKPGHPRGISCCIHSRVAHTGPRSVGLVFAYDTDLRMQGAT